MISLREIHQLHNLRNLLSRLGKTTRTSIGELVKVRKRSVLMLVIRMGCLNPLSKWKDGPALEFHSKSIKICQQDRKVIVRSKYPNNESSYLPRCKSRKYSCPRRNKSQ